MLAEHLSWYKLAQLVSRLHFDVENWCTKLLHSCAIIQLLKHAIFNLAVTRLSSEGHKFAFSLSHNCSLYFCWVSAKVAAVEPKAGTQDWWLKPMLEALGIGAHRRWADHRSIVWSKIEELKSTRKSCRACVSAGGVYSCLVQLSNP